jgi:hypothetical protein
MEGIPLTESQIAHITTHGKNLVLGYTAPITLKVDGTPRDIYARGEHFLEDGVLLDIIILAINHKIPIQSLFEMLCHYVNAKTISENIQESDLYPIIQHLRVWGWVLDYKQKVTLQDIPETYFALKPKKYLIASVLASINSNLTLPLKLISARVGEQWHTDLSYDTQSIAVCNAYFAGRGIDLSQYQFQTHDGKVVSEQKLALENKIKEIREYVQKSFDFTFDKIDFSVVLDNYKLEGLNLIFDKIKDNNFKVDLSNDLNSIEDSHKEHIAIRKIRALIISLNLSKK